MCHIVRKVVSERKLPIIYIVECECYTDNLSSNKLFSCLFNLILRIIGKNLKGNYFHK